MPVIISSVRFAGRLSLISRTASADDFGKTSLLDVARESEIESAYVAKILGRPFLQHANTNQSACCPHAFG